ncbi:MAG: methyltransferase domain-containing protein [Chloroflexi bacterium]|nr:methyltransferase domain-containing protein [Chloroflexota bacterium]
MNDTHVGAELAPEARFDAVAADYEKHVTPLFRGPAADLIERAALQPGEKVLDVGTGPGLAALFAASKVGPTGSVTGVDLSEAMLAIARQRAAKEGLGVEYLRGDAEALDYPAGSFDAVVSNFGLGTTDPDRSLPSIRRVIKPGGRFALTHWGPSSRPAQAFYDLMRRRRVAEPTPRLEWLRNTDLTARPWESQIKTPEALAALLAGHGFQNVQSSLREYAFTFADSDAYLDMSLSFPLSRAEFDALSPGNQRMFKHEFNALMAPFRGPNRSVISRDAILFAVARAPDDPHSAALRGTGRSPG